MTREEKIDVFNIKGVKIDYVFPAFNIKAFSNKSFQKNFEGISKFFQ